MATDRAAAAGPPLAEANLTEASTPTTTTVAAPAGASLEKAPRPVSLRLSSDQWRADKDVKECQACKARFSAFLRRHHCRSCGGNHPPPLAHWHNTYSFRHRCEEIFCNSCSAHTVQGNRTCVWCWQALYPD